jgi:thiol:disulfide interchange protein
VAKRPASHRFLAFTTVDKSISSFTLLVAPCFFLWSVATQRWHLTLILGTWWLISRAVKLLPHFGRKPQNLVRLPLFIGISIYMALLKIFALLTIGQHKWLTRDVAVVDGQVQRLSPGGEDLRSP